MPVGRPPLMLRGLLILISLGAGCLLAEAGYRSWLWVHLLRGMERPTYTVFREPLHVHDADFGYSYAPGKAVFSCQVVGGVVQSCGAIQVDRRGNLDSGAPAPVDSTRVLIFGDSFTANPNQPLGWPHFFAQRSGYEVLNFARDGYGISQMLRLAAERARELRPQFIIVAFIMEDLWRGWTWRTTITRDGGAVTVASTTPSAAGGADAAELALVDPEVTPGWCESLRSRTAVKDPILARLNRRYRDLGLRHHRAFLLNPRHSLLRNRILRGDPYSGLSMPARNPVMNLMDFEMDAGIVKDIQSLSVPMLLVILPRRDDIAKWRLGGSRQGLALLTSLTRLSGVQPVLLMNRMPLDGVDVDRLYLAGDHHPSAEGSKLIGETIWEIVREQREAGLPVALDR